MRPEGELGAGGEDGGEGMGDGVKGLLLEKLKEPKERGESAPALLTMGMGEVTFLLLPGLWPGVPGGVDVIPALLVACSSLAPHSIS